MAKTLGPAEAGKWLAVAATASSVGVLPKGWQKAIAAASALLLLLDLMS
jgi:hypothetical protein